MKSDPLETPASFAIVAVAAPSPWEAITQIAAAMIALRLSSLLGLAMLPVPKLHKPNPGVRAITRPMLYPGIMRETCYWLLTAPGGDQIVHMTMATGHERRVIAAIHNMRDRFSEPIRVKDLAATARMSPPTFHRQFKSVTSMTPLQYQKQLRLLEALRLMIASNANVETAAFQVGYESASRFSREYTRMFGKSPCRDVAALKFSAGAGKSASPNHNQQHRVAPVTGEPRASLRL